jgi:hypothetical protein
MLIAMMKKIIETEIHMFCLYCTFSFVTPVCTMNNVAFYYFFYVISCFLQFLLHYTVKHVLSCNI